MVADYTPRNISAQPSAPASCPNGIILAQMFAALAVPSPTTLGFPGAQAVAPHFLGSF